MSKKIKFILIIVFLVALGYIVYMMFLPFENIEKKEASGENLARSYMSQINYEAEEIFSGEGSFTNVNCQNVKLEGLCSQIKEAIEKEPVFYSSEENYCGYVEIPSTGGYFCIDNSPFSVPIDVSTNPEDSCNGDTFKCPFN